MDYQQSKKTWYNRSGGHIIKTVYDPVTGTFTHEVTDYNKLANPSKTNLPEAILNDVLDWRNVIRENRQNE